MVEHTTRAFDTDLQTLALKIVEMSRLDEAQIRQSIEAIVKRDIDLAKSVIAAHDRVDSLQREIEEKAVVTIARRQPMAVDLRDIIGALRICNDLEKIGDLAENVAKEVIILIDAFVIDEVVLQLQRMARLVLYQLSRVLQSYEKRDAAEALAVWRNDLEIDAQQLAVPRVPHLHAGKSAQHHVLHAPLVLRQEHRADGRPHNEHRRDRLLYR
jgi:phosphate transport system protein